MPCPALLTSRGLRCAIASSCGDTGRNPVYLSTRFLLQIDFKSWLYQLNAWLNLATFVLCRFMGMVAIITGIFLWYDRVSVLYLVSISLSMVVMMPVNTILFQRLIKNDVYRFRKNAYHNKYRVLQSSAPPCETAAKVSDKRALNGVLSSSNNNKGKHGSDNGHLTNGWSNGELPVTDEDGDNDRKKQ